MSILAITPLKHNSQRLSNKNFQLLDHKPLYKHSVDRVYALCKKETSNNQRVSLNITCAIYCNYHTWFMLDDETQSRYLHVLEDDTPTGQDGNVLFKKMVTAFQDQWFSDIEWCFVFNVTSPFISLDTYRNIIYTIHDDPEYDSACTVAKICGRTWVLPKTGNSIPMFHNPALCQRTQDQDPLYVESEACWLFKPSLIQDHHRRVGFYPKFVEVTHTEAIDIDYKSDLEIARTWVEKEL